MSENNGRLKEYTCPLFGTSNNCTAMIELKAKVLKSLEWMILDNKWRSDDQRQNLEPGSQGGYSIELTEAIELLEELQR